MLPSHLIGWPICHSDPWRGLQPLGGIAPLRHDSALARHLEKRSAYRTLNVHQVDLWASWGRRWAGMARKLIDLISQRRSTAP